MKRRVHLIMLTILVVAVGFLKAYAVEKVPERTEPPAKIQKSAPQAPSVTTPAPGAAPTPAPSGASPTYTSDIRNAHCNAREAVAQGGRGDIAGLRKYGMSARTFADGALGKIPFPGPLKDGVRRAQNLLYSATSASDVRTATGYASQATQELERTGYRC
jgi:hypothetical protein